MTILKGSVVLVLATTRSRTAASGFVPDLSELPECESIHAVQRARRGLVDKSCISDSRWRWSVLNSSNP